MSHLGHWLHHGGRHYVVSCVSVLSKWLHYKGKHTSCQLLLQVGQGHVLSYSSVSSFSFFVPSEEEKINQTNIFCHNTFFKTTSSRSINFGNRGPKLKPENACLHVDYGNAFPPVVPNAFLIYLEASKPSPCLLL